MAFVPIGMGFAMSASGTLRRIKMNTLEQSLTDNRENLKVEGTLISRASRRTPVRSSILGARKKPWPLMALLLLMPLVAADGLVHLGRTVPLGLTQQEFEGAAACGGFLLWRVIHALDSEQSLQTPPPATSPSPLSSSEPNLSNPRKIQSSLPPDALTASAAPVAPLPTVIRT